MNGFFFKSALYVGLLSFRVTTLLAQQKTEKPNIILILADDLGYMDVNCFASHLTGTPISKMFYETPNIDQLAAEGICFSQAYVCPLSSPTRSSILTGKYAARMGFTTATPALPTYYNQNKSVPTGYYIHDAIFHSDQLNIEQSLINATTNTGLPSGQPMDHGRNEVTIAEALIGYQSAFIGKWHIGGHGAKGYQPGDQGFKVLASFDAGGSPYFNWRKAWNNSDKKKFPNIPQEKMMTGYAGDDTVETYLTDDLTQMALKYIDQLAQQKGQPFFLYFCHFAVHEPIQGKEEDIKYFNNKSTKGWNGHDDAFYAAMLRSLDQSVGAIMRKIKETGLDKNTLVIFLSDNGGWDKRYKEMDHGTCNSPLKGGKACLNEGGIRIPFIVWWKGKVTTEKWCNTPIDCNDIFPTILQVSGQNPENYYDKIDGRSIVSLLTDIENKQAVYKRDTFYWHYPFNVIVNNPEDSLPLTPHSAIRVKNYKLIVDWHGRLKLYDIEKDIFETKDLSMVLPYKTKELFKSLCKWMDQNIEERYIAKPNPAYDPKLDKRKDKYIDLRKKFLSN